MLAQSVLYVTGITGHSGKWFLQRLIQEKYPGIIRCLVRSKSDTASLDECGLRIEKIVGDLTDVDSLRRSMAGADTVLHIAYITNTPQVMRAAVDAGVRWVVLVHTTGIYSRYKSASGDYLRTEGDALDWRRQLGVTVLRPTMIYGARRDQNMYRLISFIDRHAVVPIVGRGRNLLQPVHARDLGNAYYDVLQARERTLNRDYNLPGGAPIAFIDLCRVIAQGLNRTRYFLRIPYPVFLATAKIMERVSKRPLLSVEQVMRMNEDKAFDCSAARADFGYRSARFEEGILEEIQEYSRTNGT
jgi:nucleoside-diphosphate-sugar epimerase